MMHVDAFNLKLGRTTLNECSYGTTVHVTTYAYHVSMDIMRIIRFHPVKYNLTSSMQPVYLYITTCHASLTLKEMKQT